MLTRNFLSVVLVVAFASSSFAADLKHENELRRIVVETEVHCTADLCDKGYSLVEVFRFNKKEIPLGEVARQSLFGVAGTMAQIWGDTILEGDYEAEGNTRLDRVMLISKNGRSLAYHITYSEKAWDTSDCQYDGRQKSTLEGCVEGRISESAYVSLDFKTYFYDEQKPAVFR